MYKIKYQIEAVFLIREIDVAEGKSSKGESFLKGTFVLTIAGFVVKVIGSLNWIFVSRILGGEGIGLYQMAFPIYFFAMTVSQAGVPVAISIITAERVALRDIYGAKRVFRISMILMLFTGDSDGGIADCGANLPCGDDDCARERAYAVGIGLCSSRGFTRCICRSSDGTNCTDLFSHKARSGYRA